jgi:predicted GNAT superfamily acetyltransferase
MAELTIRLLETPQEMTAVEALQRLVWLGSETDVIPAHMLLAACHNGGIILGAFDRDDLVGVVFGFTGFSKTPAGLQIKHHSHILAVHPDRIGEGIGYGLKCAQRRAVRKQGLELITWTYDPLLSRNAHINICRLGAVCKTYLRSEYGDMQDGLNAGLPSDRFQVDWWLRSNRVKRHLSRPSRTGNKLDQHFAVNAVLFEAGSNRGSFPCPPQVNRFPKDTRLVVEIPFDFQSLKAADLSLARDWRLATREIFEAAFARGYLVTDFVHTGARSFYILTPEDPIIQELDS